MSELRDQIAEIVGDPAYESDPMGIADRILAAVTEGTEPTMNQPPVRAGEPVDGAHIRPDGRWCNYLHNGKICNKCGFFCSPIARESELRAALSELVQAMADYQMDVDEPAPYKHRDMIKRARTALAYGSET